ncbi:MAG: primosomal protein N' [Saprospiraceae bacterium]|nr:primosomal protein N' [Candidatus Vicinibacter proximus]MBL7823949.1 primosomal protein N' [Saprospiraceae bacterium]
MEQVYAEIIVPLAAEGCFTYIVPEEFKDRIAIGKRVEVEFGKRKHYAGIVKSLPLKTNWPNPKPILDILDEEPIVDKIQLDFWIWISEYYLCSIGDVMSAALPSAFRLASETHFLKKEEINYLDYSLSNDEFLILEALDIRNELSVLDIRNILQKKSILKPIKKLIDDGLILVTERLSDQEKLPKIKWIRLNRKLTEDSEEMNRSLLSIQKSQNQSRLVLCYLNERRDKSWIKLKELLNISGCSSTVSNSLLQKGIFEQIELEKYSYPETTNTILQFQLSAIQQTCLEDIKSTWLKKSVVLLRGITGSGKTQIYMELIKENILLGKQVLYLVPEIALTSQLVQRIKKYFGTQLIEYHSGLSQKDRLAVWEACKSGHPLIVGARSSLFLPYQKLGLIIVDEEHDPSYKQNDPSPRYNARDCAFILAQDHNAKILLGSATPSLESYSNVINDRFGSVVLDQRFGESQLPEVKLVSLKEASQFGKLKGHFTEELLEAIEYQIERKKQILIFRNRRGYSPLLQCGNCNWEAYCDHCDIHMTLHKYQQKLKCHICGSKRNIPTKCPRCEQHTLKFMGFGTEKIEEELKEYFPDLIIKRFDQEIARSKSIQTEILEAFQDKEIDILVGTQMITKGLDFEHVGLVAIIQADQILHYPDFRAQERAFQLMTQVSGRSGRREDLGQVIIQAYAISHPVINDVMNHDFKNFIERELLERKRFNFPPFVRLIRIELRHLKSETVDQAAIWLINRLSKFLGKRVLGPSEPPVARIKGAYAREIYLKLERKNEIILKGKQKIKEYTQKIKSEEGWGSIRVIIDVDPY